MFPKLDTERETLGLETLSQEGGKKVFQREAGPSAGEWKGSGGEWKLTGRGMEGAPAARHCG